MLITFTSQHSPDVVMFGAVATMLLRGMGASETPPGILRGENIRTAAEKLRQFLATLPADAEQHEDEAADDDNEDKIDQDDAPKQRVSLDQRALPLLEMLDTAYREQCDVIWR